MISYLTFGIIYAFACVVQPGPFQTFLFSQSLTHGWRKTFPLVFTPLLSDIPVSILVLLVLTNVPPTVMQAFQCFGGVFLLYLAFNAYNTWRKFYQTEKPEIPHQQNFFKAVVVNLLNPNPYLGWSLVMGPILIKGWHENPLNGIVLLLGFYSCMIVYSTGMIMVFAATGNLGPRVNRISIGISVIALAIFGLYQLLSGISAFL
jgi:threonine/homoserine/homoserine lactone efflux protein